MPCWALHAGRSRGNGFNHIKPQPQALHGPRICAAQLQGHPLSSKQQQKTACPLPHGPHQVTISLPNLLSLPPGEAGPRGYGPAPTSHVWEGITRTLSSAQRPLDSSALQTGWPQGARPAPPRRRSSPADAGTPPPSSLREHGTTQIWHTSIPGPWGQLVLPAVPLACIKARQPRDLAAARRQCPNGGFVWKRLTDTSRAGAAQPAVVTSSE